MAFWWVNHKQTHKEEIDGEFIWSPKVEKNGRKNNSYDNMPKTAIGDIIFSFANAQIKAIGTITTPCIEQEKPESIKKNGSSSWGKTGWYVGVQWQKLSNPFRIKDHIDSVTPFISITYSPIQKNGSGNQKCYLANISCDMANMLLQIASKYNDICSFNEILDIQIEDNLYTLITETESYQLIQARKGQGIFRKNVIALEKKCRITSIHDHRFLIASHIKPWRQSSNTEKLDGNNGLLLSPHIDKLFDQGWISFTDDGNLLISNNNIIDILKQWNIPKDTNIGLFNIKQKEYLNYHRSFIFKAVTV
ncbi:HNH endonuclease [Photobacterium kishitanii]|uniref:HNH endonuclease n=1 Tax=Photobacterium kishitanii TaxID=318456 RepID=UPI000D15BFCD|nr:HNH endonuclease signature motif containing protein [Photobacterium kishitanii]PSV15265.1 HNH endonuclease [Photobacterium kishitanii]